MKAKDLSKLISLRTLQRITDYYELSLGFHLTIRNRAGELLLKDGRFSSLWNYIHANPQAEQNLHKILEEAFAKCERTGQIVIFERHPDTHAFAAPIYINGKISAFFVGGLVRFGNPNLEIAKEQAEKLGVSLDCYLEAHLDLPYMTPERFEAAANLIKIIGSTIYTLEIQGNEVKVNQKKIETEYQKLSEDLQKATEELNKSLNRYRTVFEKSTDGIYVADLSGKMIEINQAGATMLGYTNPSDLVGKPIKDLYVHPKDRHKFKKLIDQTGQINHWVAHLVTPTGEQKYYDTNASIITNKQKQPLYIQGIFRDIETKDNSHNK